MKHKIIFFDVDGTLTSYLDGSITESTKMAIQQLIKKGYHVVAATGRPYAMCNDIAQLGIDTFITANGAYVKHKNEVIHKIPFNYSIMKDVSNYASIQKNALTFYSESLHINEIRHPNILKALSETLSLTDYPELRINDCETYLLCLFANRTMVKKYEKPFPSLTFKRWHPFIVNVLEQDVSKSIAILKVLEYFQYTKEEAIAFGDGENDLDMLEVVDIGIAMGNANDKLKQCADFITKSSDEDGILYALQHYGILK
jgi:Cof subfamily protein (haloacid dehalogenase superfamily)